ncbi:MAG: hypothetical protein PHC88_03395 [Terrimicrobiaceae bacterium]|nr:hypothetical protein [Terrimicrobiaceae bacterium]
MRLNTLSPPASIPGITSGDHAAKGHERVSAEIGGRLEEIAGQAFEGRHERQDHEGKPDVAKRQPHREQVVNKCRRRFVEDAQLHQRPVENARAAENDPPREDAHEIAAPQRQKHEDGEERLEAAGVESQKIGDRKRDGHVDRRHRSSDRQRPHERGPIGLGERGRKVLERELVDNLHVFVLLKRQAQEHAEREKIKHRHPRK